jgi:flagellar biogenesis protein FliO
MPLAPRQQKTEAATPLAPRGRAASGEASIAPGGPLLTTLGSLAVVLCLFFAVAWIMRRGTPHALAMLPGEVVEILGRAALPGRHQMHLVRCGQKLLLVAVSTTGADTLTEITDPAEVDRLCGLCRESHPKSATATFRSIFNQLGRESREAHEDDDA